VTATASPLRRARARARRILHDRRLLGLLLAGGVMAAVVVFVIGFSGAFFTATSNHPANTFSAGDLQVRLSKTGALLDGTNLRPGSTRTGTVSVTNVAHKARLTLDVSGLTNTPPSATLADVIGVTVRETSPGNVRRYDGLLKNLHDIGLGTFAAGEQRSYEIRINWPAAATDPSRRGVTTSFAFDWLGTSVP
jgi:hypothetical protein